jgi:hypothetical protein
MPKITRRYTSYELCLGTMYNANRGVGNMKKTNKIGHRLLPWYMVIIWYKSLQRLNLSFIVNVRSRFNAIKSNILSLL